MPSPHESVYEPEDRVPLPPPDAEVRTTACAYCVVGCGYKSYTWPVGREGGPRADQNAFGVEFPVSPLRPWASPNQHNVVSIGGEAHHILIVPDADARVVNRRGNHSIRGGTLALKCYNPDTPTRDRLRQPQIRVNGVLTPIDWDTAIEIMATVSRHVIDRYGRPAWGMKAYTYEFFENTYAITKLAFQAIQTPAYAPHDKPGPGADTAGLEDSGLVPFSSSYEDWAEADVVFVSGTDPFETKSVLFTEWMMKGGAKLIMANPRRTAGVRFAEENGGLHLAVIPGSDTLLHLAIARIVLENGWEDREFIERWIASSWEIYAGFGRGTRNTPWQWRTTWGKFGTDFDGYRRWLLAYEPASLEHAAAVTGVEAARIRRAAEMLTGAGGSRPKASFALEKGNYWSNNYGNTTSFAAMGLLCGAGNRPGQRIDRLGGHQRGWMAAAPYPIQDAPEKLPGRRRKEIDFDRWVKAGKLRFAWVIGTSWTGAMAASQELAQRLRQTTRANPHQLRSADPQHAIETLIRRVDSGGMVIVDSDIYPVTPINTELADIVLPAAAWGEHDGARCNGERRLRLYSRLYDPPGEARPDWWAVAAFARKMGFDGFDWKDDNDVFEEAARFSRGGVLDYYVLVWRAWQEGRRGHDLLRELGTEGIQTPIRWEGARMVGTKRLLDATVTYSSPEGPTLHEKFLTRFDSHSGKALLMKSSWEDFSDFYERIRPDPSKGELWVTNGRINEVWQSAFDDIRKPYVRQRWPDTFVEVHPENARPRRIESGDEVRVWNDDVLIQTGGFVLAEGGSESFTRLEQSGRIRVGRGEVRAVAIVTEAVRPGVLFLNFLHLDSPANSLVHRVPDPVTNRDRFKLGKGRVEKVGESPHKHSFSTMSFQRRDVGLRGL